METHNFKPQEEVNRIKEQRAKEIQNIFEEHKLDEENRLEISLLRGHVISMATELEEIVEVLTEFYYLRGLRGTASENFELSYLGASKGLKEKVENLVMIIKTSRPIFAGSCNDLLIELTDFPSTRNIFAHWYAHKSKQMPNLIVLHTLKRKDNTPRLKTEIANVNKYVNDLYKKWVPLRYLMQQFFELIITNQDRLIDTTYIDKVKEIPDFV